MYSTRRPWSPEPDYPPYPSHHPQREASDISVEALDLADYARTLRNLQPQTPYMTTPELHRDDTHSSSSPGPSNSSGRGRERERERHRARPFSLPASPRHPDLSLEPQEQDISHFPPWSRNWYTNNTATSLTTSPTADIYSPLPTSHFDSARHKSHNSYSNKNHFDPNYTFSNSRPQIPNTYSQSSSLPGYWNEPPPPSFLSHSQTPGDRDILPWSAQDPHSYGDDMVDPLTKEERIRMLEREFGPNAKPSKSDEYSDDDPPPIGSVNPRTGLLVTAGPKKRLAARWLQITFAAVAAIPGIYAVAMNHTRQNDRGKLLKPGDTGYDTAFDPPPKGTAAAYVLYVLSVITLIGLIVFFVFWPCCCGRRKRKGQGPEGMGMGGMMVLPVVQGLAGGKKKNKKGYKKMGRGGMPGQDVQVNLIVDPTMFGGGRREESEDEEEGMPGSWGGSAYGGSNKGHGAKRPRRPKRRGVFEGLALEKAWREARSYQKKLTVVDVFGMLLWGAVFVYVVFVGKKCPVGGWGGWCNAFNASAAAGCLLCVAFGVSLFFDVVDLHSSKQSPRTRS